MPQLIRTTRQILELLSTKADLVSGKIPIEQLPTDIIPTGQGDGYDEGSVELIIDDVEEE